MFNPEAEMIARIESAEIQIRSIRKRIEHAPSPADRRVLNQQISELTTEISRLKERLVPRPPKLSAAVR